MDKTLMPRTSANLAKIRTIMNTNPRIQEIMTELTQRAIQQGMSVNEWENFKMNMLENMLFKMCEMMPEWKHDMAEDFYEEINA